MKLRYLRDSELPEVEERARLSGISLDTCPTCGSKLEYREEWGGYDRENGTYRFRGKVRDCDCESQISLRKHYLLANIPMQYQRLNWEEYDGSNETQEAVKLFLDRWEGFRSNGMGIEFSGSDLGTGKTFAATHVGKELIKNGESVYFISFRDLIDAIFSKDEHTVERVRETPIVILDEVVPPSSDQQAKLFTDRFESIIRHRTNWNAVTIMTTNLTEKELRQYYPRPYSLLEAKQIRIHLSGEDQRMGKIGMENIELAANMEVRPIT
jgi:DNA replication protein DnaC